MNTETRYRKPLVRALGVVVCLDEAVRMQRVSDSGRAHLSQAEATLSAAKGPELLQAFRDWIGSGMPRSNPAGSPVRVLDEKSEKPDRPKPGHDRR